MGPKKLVSESSIHLHQSNISFLHKFKLKFDSSHFSMTRIRQLKYVADGDISVSMPENVRKRIKLEANHDTSPRECEDAVQKFVAEVKQIQNNEESDREKILNLIRTRSVSEVKESVEVMSDVARESAKYGVTSVRGRRRDMEDAVSIHPQIIPDCNFYGVFDGHGCSHVALKCKAGMHKIVREELEREGSERCGQSSWKVAMERSFSRMDKEVHAYRNNAVVSNCRCELQTPLCDAVGSTAVVSLVTPEKIVVSNCGDSRAILCRNGVAIPLSSDHKPDRPDELKRIESAGGRVIYWEGPRVLGVLAMSRAIGDNYLKPYVIPDPEVTITDRTPEDECLILASDGLWDVVSNEMACGVVRMCLNASKPLSPPLSHDGTEASSVLRSAGGMSSDKACMDASVLLTKLALARQSQDNVSVLVVDLRRDS